MENLAESLYLQDRATKWHYNRNSYPHPQPIANVEGLGIATLGLMERLSAERPDNLVYWMVHRRLIQGDH